MIPGPLLAIRKPSISLLVVYFQFFKPQKIQNDVYIVLINLWAVSAW
jgi:hypothetical protein